MKRRLLLLAHPIAVGVALIALFGALHTLASFGELLLLTFFSVLVATVLTYPINLLSRWLPRSVAVVVTLVVLSAAVVAVGVVAAPAISREIARITEQLPEAAARLKSFWYGARRDTLSQLPEGERVAETLEQQLAQGFGALVSSAVPAAATLLSGVSIGILLFALAFFLAANPQSYRVGLLRLVPTDLESAFDEAWRRLGTAIRHWMGGILVSMTIMGVLTAAGLWLAGVDGWWLLGLLTFLCTFIPYAGAVASAIPGLAVGLAESPRRFFYACAVYLVVHLVEGYLVEPLIMRRAAALRPAVLLFWQLLMGAVFGVAGVAIATPLLVCVQVAVNYFYVERMLGKPTAARG